MGRKERGGGQEGGGDDVAHEKREKWRGSRRVRRTEGDRGRAW